MGQAYGVELDEAGVDLISFRTARDSTTRVLVYVEGEYLGGFVGNIDPDGSSDYQAGMRGPMDGHYLLKAKPLNDYEKGPLEYLPGTPSITGNDCKVGQPDKDWKPTVRFHPCGNSTGCQTAPLEWANRIWDFVEKYPETTHLHLKTVKQLVEIPLGGPLSKPQSHPWPAFNRDRKKSIS